MYVYMHSTESRWALSELKIHMFTFLKFDIRTICELRRGTISYKSRTEYISVCIVLSCIQHDHLIYNLISIFIVSFFFIEFRTVQNNVINNNFNFYSSFSYFIIFKDKRLTVRFTLLLVFYLGILITLIMITTYSTTFIS